MTREELIAYDRWLTENKWGSSEIITPEQAADLYLAKHPLPPAEGAEHDIESMRKCLHHYINVDEVNRYDMLVFGAMRDYADDFAAQQQPTAEGAEEIEAELRGYARDIVRLHKPIMEVNPQLAMDSIGNDLVKMFNRLAQRIADKMKEANQFILDIAGVLGIETDGVGFDGLTLSIDDFKEAADKMVEERLREELMEFYLHIDKHWALGMLTDKVDDVIDEYIKTTKK